MQKIKLSKKNLGKLPSNRQSLPLCLLLTFNLIVANPSLTYANDCDAALRNLMNCSTPMKTHKESIAKYDTIELLSDISGYEQAYARAIKVLGSTTTQELPQTKVFFTIQGDDLFAVTNHGFVPGRQRKTILTDDKSKPVSILVKSLVGNEELTKLGPEKLSTQLPRVQIYLDSSVLRNKNWSELDFGSTTDVCLVDSKGRVTKIFRESTQSKDWYIPLRGRRVVADARIEDPNIEATLSRQHFFGNNKVCSLVGNDSEHTRVYKNFPAKNKVAFSFDTAKLIEQSKPTLEDLKVALSKHVGSGVQFVGHVEGDSFVVYVKGKEPFRVPFAWLDKTCELYRISPSYIGCKTGGRIKGGVVTKTDIVTYKIIENIEKGLKSKNYLEFLDMVAGPDVKLVVSHTVIDPISKKRTVYINMFIIAGMAIGVTATGIIVLEISQDK